MADREKLIRREIGEIQKSKKYETESFFIRENVPENIKRKNVIPNWEKQRNILNSFFSIL